MNRKNIIYGLLTIAMVALWAVSCKEPTMKMKNLNYADREFLLPEDTAEGVLSVSIQVELPETYTNTAVLATIRNTLITSMFGKNYIAIADDSVPQKYFAELAADYRNSNEPIVRLIEECDPLLTLNYEHNLEGFTVLNTPHFYSYGYERYVYAGGAHGLNTTNYLNFDLADGHLIVESDLFAPETQTALVALLKKGIVQQQGIADLEQSPFYIDSIKPNNNFYISDEGITFVFNPYEIAPYYVGKTEVLLTCDDIAPLLKANSPIAIMIEKNIAK